MANKNRYMEISWPEFGVTVTAELLEDKAPQLCQRVWDHLPYQSTCFHGWVAGESLAWKTADGVELAHMENLAKRIPGTLYVYRDLMGLPFGYVTEPGKVNRFGAVVDEDIGKYDEIGLTAWRRFMTKVGPPLVVKLARKE